MTFQQELKSWVSPTRLNTASAPNINEQAPSSNRLVIPGDDGRPTVVSFLRHCGCPFAEKTLLLMRESASSHPGIRYVAVSQSENDSTERWLSSIGGAGNVDIIVDPSRDLFAQWGLGVSSAWYVLSPSSLWSVYQLGSKEGIWNRPTESGSRWQKGGNFAADKNGIIKWGAASKTVSEIPDFEDVVQLIQN